MGGYLARGWWLIGAMLVLARLAVGGAPGPRAGVELQGTIGQWYSPAWYQGGRPTANEIPSVVATPRLYLETPSRWRLTAQAPLVIIAHDDGNQLFRVGDAEARLRYRQPMFGGLSLIAGAGQRAAGDDIEAGGDTLNGPLVLGGLEWRLGGHKRLTLEAERLDGGADGRALQTSLLYTRGERYGASEYAIGLITTSYSGAVNTRRDDAVQLVVQTTLFNPDTRRRRLAYTTALTSWPDGGLGPGWAQDYYWDFPLAGTGNDAPASARRDRAFGAPSWGPVTGVVRDARTGAPLTGARITVWQDGAFAASGATVGATDARGRYDCRARLGRISSAFVFAGLASSVAQSLLNAPVSVLTGPMVKDTRRMDCTQLILRVTRDGYQPFEGVVPCADLDARRFLATMAPVLLAPADTPDTSTTAPGWRGSARLTSLEVSPAVLHPGDTATITARLHAPGGALDHLRVAATLARMTETPTGPQIAGAWNAGAMPVAQRDGDAVTLRATLTIPRKARAGAYHARVTLEDTADILDPSRGVEARWCQIVARGTTSPAVAARTRAWAAEQDGDGTARLEAWQEVTASKDATLDDWYRLARAAKAVGAHGSELEATDEIRARCPRPDRSLAVAAYGDALRRAGKPADALALLRQEWLRLQTDERKRWDDDDTDITERISQLPVALLAACGRAAVAAGDLETANTINAALLHTLDLTGSPDVPAFRRELRTRRAQQGVLDRPEDAAAWAEYGRWLLDEGRAGEAESALAKALALQASHPAIAADLAAARRAMGGPPPPEPPLAVLVEQAARAAGDGPGLAPSHDCADWQRYGLLLLRQAARARAAADTTAPALQARALRALGQAVVTGRAGADFEGIQMTGGTAYAGETRYVTGYATPGIARTAILLTALRRLEGAPDDYHAWRQAGDALLAENEPESAAEAVDACVRLAPDRAETLALRARLAEAREQRDEAARLWREVLAKNPNDPDARPRLGALAARNGDFAAATGYLMAHGRLFGMGGGTR